MIIGQDIHVPAETKLNVMHDGLCDEQGPIPMFDPVQADEHGRIIMSDEEGRARSAAGLRALKAQAKIPDTDPPGTYDLAMDHLTRSQTMSDPTATKEPPALTPTYDGLCDEQGPIPIYPRERVDERGRLIPISEEENKLRSDAAIRTIKAAAKIPDNEGDDVRWREAMRDLDAQRPHRPLFEGMY
jgi:hypothetical protein